MEAYPRPAAERRSHGEALAGGTGVRGRYRQLREIARKAFNHPLNGFARVLRNRARGGTGPLLKALVRLKRSRLTQTTFIGITGSCGKSTAVMLAKAILSSSGKCLSPSVGKQTTTMDRAWLFAADAILNTNSTVKFCVLETHAPSPGIIGEMLDLLRPQIGAVTVVGGDHRKNYRSLEATAQEKGLQVECLPASGFAILNLDDPNVAGMIGRTRAQVLTYGRSAQADLRASEVSSAWPARLSLRIDYRGDNVFVETRLLGEHWIASILAATGIALACGIDLKTCAEIIATFEPAFGRYTVSPRPDGGAFVLDVNKAPFWTIPDGLAFVKAATAPRRTVVFGTISDYSAPPARVIAKSHAPHWRSRIASFLSASIAAISTRCARTGSNTGCSAFKPPRRPAPSSTLTRSPMS